MRGRSDRKVANLGLEKNGEDRIVMPTNRLLLLMAVRFERYGIGDSTGRLKIQRA